MLQLFLKTLRADARQMLPFHVLVMAYAALVVALTAWRGVFTGTAYARYFMQLAPLYFVSLPLMFFILHALHRTIRHRVFGKSDIEEKTPVLLGRLASSALTLASFLLFMGTFTTFKTLMPILRGGFPYDIVQADIDALLHGGDPGRKLAQALESPWLLQLVQWNYDVLWMMLAFLPIFFIAVWNGARAIRLRYFLTFACVWIVLGNVIACLFLSAGPIFYAEVTGDAARFSAQMAVLQEYGAWSFRDYLWESYRSGTAGVGTGISAFPSLHVGAAMMNALFLREINRLAGVVGFLYAGFVTFSSVLLGWHYAIDGYTSIIVVCLLYIAVKRAFASRRSGAPQTLIPSAVPPGA